MKTREAFLRKAKRIIEKKQQHLVNGGEITENYGNKELRKFNDEINQTDLPYGIKADLSAYLSEQLSHINQNGVIL